MQNLMLVKVKYTNSAMILSSERFTYDNYDGTAKTVDRVRIGKKYDYERYLDQAVDYLKAAGHNVLGTDDSAQGVSYIVLGPRDNGFKSVSGNHESRLERN